MRKIAIVNGTWLLSKTEPVKGRYIDGELQSQSESLSKAQSTIVSMVLFFFILFPTRLIPSLWLGAVAYSMAAVPAVINTLSKAKSHFSITKVK